MAVVNRRLVTIQVRSAGISPAMRSTVAWIIVRGANQRQQLFGPIGSAGGPKSGSRSASHDYRVQHMIGLH